MTLTSCVGRSTSILFVLLFVGMGCGQRRGNGAAVLADASVDLGNVEIDLGAPVLDLGAPVPDLGAPVPDMNVDTTDLGAAEPDAGTEPVDLGTPLLDMGSSEPDFGVSTPDLGTEEIDMGVDSGPDCAPHTVNHYTGTYCSDSTLTCVRACTNDACTYACLNADPNPSCLGCFDSDSVYCFYNNGCASAYEDYWCCADAHCPSLTYFDSCVASYCTPQRDILVGCTIRVNEGGLCVGSALACWNM